MLFPTNFEQKIEFITIRQLLRQLCTFPLGIQEVDKMDFETNAQVVVARLDETSEVCEILQDSSLDLPLGSCFDLRESLLRVRIEGLYVDESELFHLRQTLYSAQLLFDFIAQLDEVRFPRLKSLSGEMLPVTPIIRRADEILNKFGKIKDNASPELAQIRQQLFSTQGSVSATLQSILRQAQKDGLVEKDVLPTMREGRLVIPVPPAYKRKLGGIVHDESATGKTVFVEPAQVVEANNRIRELEAKERREMVRILLAFTDFLRPFIPQIGEVQQFLGKIDFIRAKALFAIQVEAIRPTLLDEQVVEWYQARHPLLELSLRKQQRPIVPLDIVLNPTQRILLISGPNAGGKSVCLKTVAMLQYMMQCGLLVPMKESSRMAIFERLFIDIGDEQSIENDLSTYSSHLLNMKFFVRNSQWRTLLLIDEFGTGTEPQIGGAIAEATLEQLNGNGAYGVITTHYTNLKHYAEETEGIVNGAMLYDRHQLKPLFQLQIGLPGSSFAVEIARKIGLPEQIIQRATDMVGAEHVDYDKFLQDIARDKRYWENKRRNIQQQSKQLEEKVAKYEAELSQINAVRKEITNKAKQEAKVLLERSNAMIENTIRQIKEAQAEKESTKELRANLRQFSETLSAPEKQGKTADSTPKKTKTKNPTTAGASVPLQAGDSVVVEGSAMVGTILEVHGKKATVAVGELKTTVLLHTLQPVSKTQQKQMAKRSQITYHQTEVARKTSDDVRERKLHFKHDLDVRGFRGNEALEAVTYFIDDAIIVSAGTVRILHGTGSGILRQLIRQYLHTVHGVTNVRDEHVEFGGAGITLVDIE